MHTAAAAAQAYTATRFCVLYTIYVYSYRCVATMCTCPIFRCSGDCGVIHVQLDAQLLQFAMRRGSSSSSGGRERGKRQIRFGA
uniref:Secreted protein n=1 Tax=Trichogramma kaykai TaxID=54128 RepID=A0ABD2WCB8_9HYME